jgi:hypothetical protein
MLFIGVVGTIAIALKVIHSASLETIVKRFVTKLLGIFTEISSILYTTLSLEKSKSLSIKFNNSFSISHFLL